MIRAGRGFSYLSALVHVVPLKAAQLEVISLTLSYDIGQTEDTGRMVKDMSTYTKCGLFDLFQSPFFRCDVGYDVAISWV